MPRITLDPSLEVRPDFTSVAYDALCMVLARAQGIEKDVAAARLVEAWDVDNNTRRTAWHEQQQEDAVAAEDIRKMTRCLIVLPQAPKTKSDRFDQSYQSYVPFGTRHECLAQDR